MKITLFNLFSGVGIELYCCASILVSPRAFISVRDTRTEIAIIGGNIPVDISLIGPYLFSNTLMTIMTIRSMSITVGIGGWILESYISTVHDLVWRFHALSASKAIFKARTYSRRPITCLAGDDDYLMNETSRTPTTGSWCPTLFDKWHCICYMPICSRTDTAGHTKAQ